MAKSLFKVIQDPNIKRTSQILLRVNREESVAIKKLAGACKLSQSEYLRRAALGRRAEVDRDTDLVLALSAITAEVRKLHAALLTKDIRPPAEIMALVLDEALVAIRAITESI
jgi:hypothetical protein